MGLGYSLLADLLGTMMFFYVPLIYFMKPKKGNRYVNYFLILSLFMVWEILFRYIYVPSVSYIYMISSYLYILIMLFLFYEGSWKKKVLCLLSIVAVSFVSDGISVFLFMYIFPDLMDWYINASVENESLTNAARIMGNMTSEVVNMVYALIYLCIVVKKRWKMFFSLMLIPIYQAFLVFGYFMMCNDFNEHIAWIGMAMAVFNLILNIVILYLLEKIFKKLDMQEEMLDISRRQQEEYKVYQAESQSVEQMRLIRHDFMNQLQTAYSMMDEPENAGKVKDMIGQMKERLEER